MTFLPEYFKYSAQAEIPLSGLLLQKVHGGNETAFQTCFPFRVPLFFGFNKGSMMDWKIFASTFLTIFLAEMGDKTQFAALAASSQTKSTATVLLAVVLALGLAGALGVIFGRFLGNFLNPQIMRYVSGALFILVGIWVLTTKN